MFIDILQMGWNHQLEIHQVDNFRKDVPENDWKVDTLHLG